MNIPRFVKWAGGKHQLLAQFQSLFPKKIENYFEPFVGGGAVAFYVIQKYNPKNILLSDINEELINAYVMIKENVNELVYLLKIHKEKHMKDPKGYYYLVRDQDPAKLNNIEKAARFIYLNRTCFNGLYRVNSSGKFNVPIGSYKNPDIVQEDKLLKISELLKNVKLEVMPFDKITNYGSRGDFVYFDPPYDPLIKGKSFTTYTKSNFLNEEQILLAKVFSELDKKGCSCMLSNSDTEFITELYSKFNINKVKAKRLINSDASKRGEINEIVVRNY